MVIFYFIFFASFGFSESLCCVYVGARGVNIDTHTHRRNIKQDECDVHVLGRAGAGAYEKSDDEHEEKDGVWEVYSS